MTDFITMQQLEEFNVVKIKYYTNLLSFCILLEKKFSPVLSLMLHYIKVTLGIFCCLKTHYAMFRGLVLFSHSRRSDDNLLRTGDD